MQLILRLTLALLLTGCESEQDTSAPLADKILEKLEDGDRAKLGALAKIATALPDIPRATAAATKVALDPPMKVSEPPQGNLLLVTEEDFLNRKSDNVLGFSGLSATWAPRRDILASIEDAKQAGKPYGAQHKGLALMVELIAQVEYLVVVRGELAAPKMRGDDTFDAGSFTGDAVVFKLATGEHLGGFALTAGSDAAIDAIVGGSRTAEKKLQGNLTSNVQSKLGAALTDFGGQPPK